MPFVTFTFFLATLIVGGAQVLGGQTLPGLSFLMAGILAFWAGSSLKLAIYAPDTRPRLIGFLLAAFFTTLGLLATVSTDVHFEAFGHDLHGAAWVVAGILAGIFGTRRRIYVVPPNA
jgi:uncharacterized membrane-anchored protein